MEKCATRTKVRVAWKVVLYCSNRASICSHALILLSQTRWIVMTGWRTCISLQLVFKHVWIVVPCCIQASVSTLLFQTRLGCGSLSAHTHQYPALCFKHVWIMVPCLCASISLQPFDQTRLDCGPCCLQASSPPCVSNTFGLWILLRIRISFQLCVSNTFGLWFRVWVQASASCFLGQTRLDCGSLLCTSISLHPCLKHV